MTREELRDYVEQERNLGNIPYHVYSTLIDGIDTLEPFPQDYEGSAICRGQQNGNEDDVPDIHFGKIGGQMQDKKDFLSGIARGIVNSVQLAYERGVKDGEEHREAKALKIMAEYSQSRFQDGYERGLNDAWEAARRIERDPEKGGLTMEQFKEVFGRYVPTSDVFSIFDVQEVLEKLQTWEEKKAKEEIKVGDEVKDGAGTKSVVMAIGNNQASLLNLDYTHVQLMPLDKLHKTGRHFGEVEDLLEKLKGEK